MNKNRVTEEQIEAKIKDKKFTVLEDGRTTICNLYLENGFTVRGECACVDPANFDKEIGERIAYKNAKDKIWFLEGYLLQQKLYEGNDKIDPIEHDFLDRMLEEGKELDYKIRKAQEKLKEWEEPVRDGNVDKPIYDLLQSQVTAMATYSNILLIRVNIERGKRNLPIMGQF